MIVTENKALASRIKNLARVVSAGGKIVKVIDALCPDGIRRNAFATNTVTKLETARLRINVQGRTFVGTCEPDEVTGTDILFTPDADSENLHLFNRPRRYDASEVGMIVPASRGFYTGETVIAIALDNGWNYAGLGYGKSDIKPNSMCYTDAWNDAEAYLSRRCALPGYYFGNDPQGSNDWGYWKGEEL